MTFLILSILGVFVIPKLSVRLNPSKSLSSININYNWPGASSYNIERDITSVLEGGLNVLKGVSKINSKSTKGRGSIVLEFDIGSDINIARFEVANIVRQLYKKLPEKVSYPVIRVNAPNEDENNRAFLSYSINAPETLYSIQEIVKKKIQPELVYLKGIDKVQIFGAMPKEYIIVYDLLLLKKLSISKEDILNSINQEFERGSLGEIIYNKEYISLSINHSKELSWHIPIRKIDGKIIYLDQVTTIREQEQEPQDYYRVNSKNAITMSIYAFKNTNTILLSKEINEKIEEIKSLLPNGYEIINTYDSTKYLTKELNKIYERTLYTIAILLFFIFIISRNIHYLFVITISLVSNLSIAFLFYFIFQIEIHLYSLAGITISLGLLIDNCLVMVDHIKKQNSTTVFLPILASTLTTVGSLSVIYFLDDYNRLNLIDFALVIIINLIASLFVALFLIPSLSIKLSVKNKKSENKLLSFENSFYRKYINILKVLLSYKKIAITLIILIFGIPFFMLPLKLKKNDTTFEKIYNSTIGNSWYIENARPYIDRYLGGSFRLFNDYVFANAYYGKNEEVKLHITGSMDKGATVHQMNEAFLEIENFLKNFNEIKTFTTRVYTGNYAEIEIIFKESLEDSSFPYRLKSILVNKALDLGGIDWDIYGVGNIFSNQGGTSEPVNFTVIAKGYNYENLNSWADTLKTSLEQHPRIQKVIIKENSYWARKPPYEYRFSLDKEKIALKKKIPIDILEELKVLTLSKQPDISIDTKKGYMPVRLESRRAEKYDVWNIKNTPIDSINNPLILKNIVNVYKERGDENIFKENQEYVRLIQFKYVGASKYGTIYLNNQLDILKSKLPLGYFFEKSSNKRLINDNSYGLLLFYVLGIIYFICAILFESFKQPLIILSIIPISFIGVFLTFYLFDFNFDQGGLASFVLLSGITVNASIFIINGFNKLKKEFPKQNYINLYIEAFKQKIFPITLTIISTILGFIPFVKDGQNEVFWFALGAGTIGGLLFSLLGILIYLPLFTLKQKRLVE